MSTTANEQNAMTISASRSIASPMSDNSRRAICRALFLFLCFVPTCGVLYFLAHRPSTEDWQEMIQAKLGINVQIESLETPRPGYTVLRGLEITNPNGGNPLEVTEVEILNGNVNEIKVREMIAVEPHNLMSMIDRATEHALQPYSVSTDWHVNLAKMAFRAPVNSNVSDFILKDLNVYVQVKNKDIEMTASMQQPFDETARPIQCAVSLRNELGESKRNFALHTFGVGVPTWLARHFVTDLNHVGESCQFNGDLEIQFDDQNNAGGWFSGQFLDIQLTELAPQFEGQLRGLASVRVDKCVLYKNQIQSLKGNFECGSSSKCFVGCDVLWTAASQFGLQTQARVNQSHTAQSSDELKFKSYFDFELVGNSIRLVAHNARIAGDDENYALLAFQDKSVSNGEIPLTLLTDWLFSPSEANGVYASESQNQLADARHFLSRFVLTDNSPQAHTAFRNDVATPADRSTH